jgi:hypothetical protein
MALASAPGPVTALCESAATAVGVGVVLGGFAAGVLGTLRGWEADRRDAAVVNTGYITGLVMAFVAAIEIVLR